MLLDISSMDLKKVNDLIVDLYSKVGEFHFCLWILSAKGGIGIISVVNGLFETLGTRKFQLELIRLQEFKEFFEGLSSSASEMSKSMKELIRYFNNKGENPLPDIFLRDALFIVRATYLKAICQEYSRVFDESYECFQSLIKFLNGLSENPFSVEIALNLLDFIEKKFIPLINKYKFFRLFQKETSRLDVIKKFFHYSLFKKLSNLFEMLRLVYNRVFKRSND